MPSSGLTTYVELERPVVAHRGRESRVDRPPRRAEHVSRVGSVIEACTGDGGARVGDPDDVHAAGHVGAHRTNARHARTSEIARSYSLTASRATCDHSCSGGWATFHARISATRAGSVARAGDRRRHLRVARDDKAVHPVMHELAHARAGSTDDRQPDGARLEGCDAERLESRG